MAEILEIELDRVIVTCCTHNSPPGVGDVLVAEMEAPAMSGRIETGTLPWPETHTKGTCPSYRRIKGSEWIHNVLRQAYR